MIEWSDLRVLVAVERHRTLTGAAKALGCDQSTVTRRLAAAQEALGVRVFDRREGSYRFNEAGERLRPYLAAVEENALAVERVALGVEAAPGGVVRLTTVETLASFFLGPHFAGLRARYPEIDLEVDVDHRTADLGRREADLALRLARPQQTQLVARKVGEIGLGLYAASAYLQKRPQRHDILCDEEVNSWTEEGRFVARELVGARVALRCRSWLTLASAAEAGLGVALLPCFIAARSKKLRRLGAVGMARGIWLIAHRDLLQVARVRAVADYLADAVAADAARLAGTPG